MKKIILAPSLILISALTIFSPPLCGKSIFGKHKQHDQYKEKVHRTIPLEAARGQVDEYMEQTIAKYEIKISEAEQRNLAQKTRLLLQSYGDRLNRYRVRKLQKQIKQYLLFSYKNTYPHEQPSPMLRFNQASSLISYVLRDDLMNTIGITDPALIRAYMKYMKISIKSNIDQHSIPNPQGNFVISHKKIKQIIKELKAALHNLSSQTRHDIKQLAEELKQEGQKPDPAPKVYKPALTEKKSPQKKASAAHAQKTKRVKKTKSSQTKNVQQANKKNHAKKQSAPCGVCNKSIKQPYNTQTYPCGHAVHKTCLFQNEGRSSIFQGTTMRDCPVCMKNRSGDTATLTPVE